MRDTLAALTRNPMSLLGSALAVTTGILLVTLIAIEIFGGEGHPYIGIITYMILPMVFAAGLILILWGILRQRRRDEAVKFPVIDLNRERTRRRLLQLLVLVCIMAVVLARLPPTLRLNPASRIRPPRPPSSAPAPALATRSRRMSARSLLTRQPPPEVT